MGMGDMEVGIGDVEKKNSDVVIITWNFKSIVHK